MKYGIRSSWPLLSAFIAAVVFFLLWRGMAGEEDAAREGWKEERAAASAAAAVRTVEGDTMVETMQTLIAQVNALEQKIQDVDDMQRAEQMPVTVQIPEALQGALESIQMRVVALEQAPREPVPLPVQLPVQQSQPPPYIVRSSLTPPRDSEEVLQAAERRHLTIPAHTIFFDAVALTALLGRVPVDGSVLDPLPVKVLVGEENIAPGGHWLPELAGMLLSGVAVGDRMLRCVSVYLHSATFVFADGTVRQFGSERGQTQGAMSDSALAWLSDAEGLPCLPGVLISDAGGDAAQQILLGAAEGYAGALGRSELSEVFSVDGNVLRSLSGDARDYARSEAIQTALQEWRETVAEQRSASFAAIYIPPGQRVLVHIRRQLELDILATDRRLVYEEQADSRNARFD